MLYNRDYRMILKTGIVLDKSTFRATHEAGMIAGIAILLAVMIYCFAGLIYLVK